MTKTKLLIYSADLRGCGLYRCIMPYRELHRKGWYDVKISQYVDMNDIAKADVVVLQRQHHDPTMGATTMALRFGKKVITENDDYFYSLPWWNTAGKKREVDENGNVIIKDEFGKDGEAIRTLRKLYSISHALTVSTPQLKRVHANENRNIFVLPNFIDENIIKESPISDIPTALWAGAGVHEGDMDVLKKPLNRFMDENKNARFANVGKDYRSRLFARAKDISLIAERTYFYASQFDATQKSLAAKFFDVHGDIAEEERETWKILWKWDGWNDGQEYAIGVGPKGEVREIKVDPVRFETYDYLDEIAKTGAWFGVAPIAQVELNACKSWIKILEYASKGIPCVASDFGQYSEIVSGYDTYTVKRTLNAFAISAGDKGDPNDYGAWFKAMNELANNKPLRDRMGKAALEFAKIMTIQDERNLNLWRDILEQVVAMKTEVTV